MLSGSHRTIWRLTARRRFPLYIGTVLEEAPKRARYRADKAAKNRKIVECVTFLRPKLSNP